MVALLCTELMCTLYLKHNIFAERTCFVSASENDHSSDSDSPSSHGVLSATGTQLASSSIA